MLRANQKWFACVLTWSLTACTGQFKLHRGKAMEATTSGTKFNAANCVDPNLSDLDKSQSISLCDGSVANGTMETPALCTTGGQENCVTSSKFVAVDVTTIDATNIVYGKSAAGVSGTMRATKQCRNAGSLAVHDASDPPGNIPITVAAAALNSATTDIIALGQLHGLTNDAPVRVTTSGALPPQLAINTPYYVTVVSPTTIRLSASVGGPLINFTSDGAGNHTFDNYGDGVMRDYDTLADSNLTVAVSPWGADYYCGPDNFTNVSAEVVPTGTMLPNASRTFSEVWRDELSGLLVTNVLYSQGAGTTTWAKSVALCNSLNGTSAGTGWRLPTQKELAQLLVNGLANVPIAGGGVNDAIRTSTGRTQGMNAPWTYALQWGYGAAVDQRLVYTHSSLCVR